MHDMLKRMQKKIKGRELSPSELEAKSDVLKELMSDMDGMMSEKLGGLKKVTVASNSKEGLKSGLEKAEDLLSGGNDSEGSDEDSNEGEELEAKQDMVDDAEQASDKSSSEMEEKLKRLLALSERE